MISLGLGLGLGFSLNNQKGAPMTISGNYYVDFVSGNDSADGLTTSSPVKTIMTGLVANKWGTREPVLAGNVSIKMMSDQTPGAELVFLRPIVGLYSLEIVQLLSGAGDAHNLAASLALGAVTAKNRATAVRLKAVLDKPYPAGSLVVNLTHASSAMIASMAGNTATLTQPITSFFTEVDTWALGDLVNIIAPTKINLNTIEWQANIAPYPAISALTSLEVITPTGVTGDGTLNIINTAFPPNDSGVNAFVTHCVFRTDLVSKGATYFFNCWHSAANANIDGGATVISGDWSFIMASPSPTSAGPAIDCDAGLQRLYGTASIGNVYASQFVGLYGVGTPSMNASTFLQSTIGGTAILWGPAGVRAGSGVRNFYKVAGSTWAAQLLVTGPLVLAGASSGQRYTIAAGVGVWTDATALTVANLDTYSAIIDPKTLASFAIQT